jgi:hypothetical protein
MASGHAVLEAAGRQYHHQSQRFHAYDSR